MAPGEEDLNLARFVAGDRLAMDAREAGIPKAISISCYDSSHIRGDSDDLPPRMIDAIRRVRYVMDAVGIAKHEIWTCVLYDETVGKMGLEFLRRGLDEVIRAYDEIDGGAIRRAYTGVSAHVN